jgi:F0F1-type ATP synthase epsilon subunit
VTVAKPLHLVVLTPVKRLIEATGVAWAQIQLADGGPIRIYPGHAPLLAETVDGPLRYADESGEHSLDLLAGILSTNLDGLTVLTAGHVQDGSAVEWEGEGAPKEAKVREDKEEVRFERLVRASLGDEGGIIKHVASWIVQHTPMGSKEAG